MVRPLTQLEVPRNEEPPDSGYRPVATYMDLRRMVFGTDPAKVASRKLDTYDRTWAMVIETGYPDAVATVIVLADGTVSLYFSTGGGLVGLGDHEQIRDAGHRLLGLGSQLTSVFDGTHDFPLPQKGRMRIYLLAYSGVLAVEAAADCPWPEPALAGLVGRVQELFAMIRNLADQITEQREGATAAQPSRFN